MPRIKRLKFDTFGHDWVVLHEIDIRRKRGAFSKLGKGSRETFLEALTQIIADVPMTVVAVMIDKRRLAQRYTNPYNPYHIGIQYDAVGWKSGRSLPRWHGRDKLCDRLRVAPPADGAVASARALAPMGGGAFGYPSARRLTLSGRSHAE